MHVAGKSIQGAEIDARGPQEPWADGWLPGGTYCGGDMEIGFLHCRVTCGSNICPWIMFVGSIPIVDDGHALKPVAWNEWCLMPGFCTVRLYWAKDKLG